MTKLEQCLKLKIKNIKFINYMGLFGMKIILMIATKKKYNCFSIN